MNKLIFARYGKQTPKMQYDFNQIEAKWQKYWAEHQTFKATSPDPSQGGDPLKPKFYVLDMFPYPSGAGLHVGHPLGYIASDIYARYKRHQGYNVMHPQGYDSFGLPAEQYAIQTGQHPAITTETNIKRYREQLDKIGFSFDWSREVRTSDPRYYKWTQWIFIQLFNSWYNKDTDRAEDIETLVQVFEKAGNSDINAACDDDTPSFSASEWQQFSTKQQQELLLKYRLTYLAESEVNWCPALGTVLANDEIVNGVSERGGHPVVQKKMTQWSMRISAYAQRLLDGLETIDWPQPLKDSQTNWIGRSEGASVTFKILPPTPSFGGGRGEDKPNEQPTQGIEVFTTRPDTIFGVSFMTLAPEHELVPLLTTPEQKKAVDGYIESTAKRSERERMADVKTISGVFTGAYAEHPFTKEPIPIWIGDYVLAGYGTGAVMSVPCGDQRDYDFAKHFDIPIPNIFDGVDISEEAFSDKEKTVIANSDFLDGLPYKKAVKRAIFELEKMGQGEGKINYRLRDAVFSRQRYWGEPFPVYYDAEGMPQMLDEECLPLELPEVDKYLPTETGEPPLGNATHWAWDLKQSAVVSNQLIDHQTVFPLELNTMPGWAGSSQYFNRYMDPQNDEAIFSKEAIAYWQDVDLYIGGSEHATGHLLYSRFWQKFMFDKGWAPKDEFAKKLINQGMITGTSAFVYVLELKIRYERDSKHILENRRLVTSESSYESWRKDGKVDKLCSEAVNAILKKVKDGGGKNIQEPEALISPNRVHIKFVDSSNILNRKDFLDDISSSGLEFLSEEPYVVSREVEKMSKSKYNVVNPDEICEQYGADSLRLYEMFLGPLEQSKPWNTSGITGVHGFLKKLWKLYHSGPNGEFKVTNSASSEGGQGEDPSAESLKTLHKTIKKVAEDIENFSFNTSVSTFMICVNELTAQKCRSRAILEPLAILVSPYAPHIAEELWEKLGHTESISTAPFPIFDATYLVESSKEYPISFNGKMRFKLKLPADMGKEDIEATVLAHEKTQEQLQGRTPKRIIVVPGKIVNIVG